MKAVEDLIWVDYGLLLFAAIYSLVYILANAIWSKRNGRRDSPGCATWGGGLTVGLLCFFSILPSPTLTRLFTFHKQIFAGNRQFLSGDHIKERSFRMVFGRTQQHWWEE